MGSQVESLYEESPEHLHHDWTIECNLPTCLRLNIESDLIDPIRAADDLLDLKAVGPSNEVPKGNISGNKPSTSEGSNGDSGNASLIDFDRCHLERRPCI
jgi:hypothetical protein